MNESREILNRAECSALRGIAILGIMLHNYCHWLKDIVRENEYLWKPDNAEALWGALQQPDELLPIHLISFFGHYGVPVFLFLSGFGLVMKYEHAEPSADISVWRFCRYNYLKLFRILLVGFVAFTMLDAITVSTHRYHFTEVVAMLGMFANLLEHPAQVVWPGPYWYFGLTLQLYLVYRLLFFRWRHWGLVLGAVLACWLLQTNFADDAELLERLRYNFIGGMLPFGIGILAGRAGRSWPVSQPGWLVILLLSVLLAFAMSYTFQTWLWIPAIIVTGAVALVKLLPQAILHRLVWLGTVSAAVFVSHPIVRKIFIHPYWREDVYAGLLLYVVASLFVAWLFMQIINKIPKPRL